jgi:acetyl-CoA C-acetyltransferase
VTHHVRAEHVLPRSGLAARAVDGDTLLDGCCDPVTVVRPIGPEVGPLSALGERDREAMTAQNVYVTGTAMTPFGRAEHLDLLGLAVSAGRAAMVDAQITPSDVDAIYVGSFLAQSLQRQGVLASLVARELGLGPVPATALEGACASAGIALRHGLMACRAGMARTVLCLGVEQMSRHSVAEVTAGLSEALEATTDQSGGLTFAGFFGLVAQAHTARYGTTREQLSAVGVKNREHGASNQQAMFRKPLAADEIASSRLIADPLRLLDCSPIADGAAAAVVSVEPTDRSVRVLAAAQASGAVALRHVDDLTTFPATLAAAAAAYAEAGVGPDDVDVAEVHDCFSVAEIVDCEDLGLLPRGEAAGMVEAGTTSARTPGLVVNPSGGLLSRGHPVGATGLAQVHELVGQLRGTAPVQVPGAQVALAHNLGGCGASATVTLLGRA